MAEEKKAPAKKASKKAEVAAGNGGAGFFAL